MEGGGVRRRKTKMNEYENSQMEKLPRKIGRIECN